MLFYGPFLHRSGWYPFMLIWKPHLGFMLIGWFDWLAHDWSHVFALEFYFTLFFSSDLLIFGPVGHMSLIKSRLMTLFQSIFNGETVVYMFYMYSFTTWCTLERMGPQSLCWDWRSTASKLVWKTKVYKTSPPYKSAPNRSLKARVLELRGLI